MRSVHASPVLVGETSSLPLAPILIACVLSDVPYNLAVKSFSGRGRIKHAEFAMASGEMSEEEFLSFLKRYLMLSIEYCANGKRSFRRCCSSLRLLQALRLENTYMSGSPLNDFGLSC